MTKQEILIIGAGGFGRELYDMLWDGFSRGSCCFKGFLAESADEKFSRSISETIIASPESYDPEPQDRFLLAIGNMDDRVRIVETLTAKGAQFLSFVHPTSVIARSSSIGRGVIVYPHAAVMNQAIVEDYVHLSIYASVGHDARVGKYSLMCPYASLNGFAVAEEAVYMSTHSTVAPNTRVGERAKISANSAAMHDVLSGCLVYGVPGKHVRLNADDVES